MVRWSMESVWYERKRYATVQHFSMTLNEPSATAAMFKVYAW